MDELFTDMAQKGLVAYHKTCKFSDLIQLICDADYRRKIKFHGDITFHLADTLPYEANNEEFLN